MYYLPKFNYKCLLLSDEMKAFLGIMVAFLLLHAEPFIVQPKITHFDTAHK